jgi:hypothetical protein
MIQWDWFLLRRMLDKAHSLTPLNSDGKSTPASFTLLVNINAFVKGNSHEWTEQI